MIDEKQKVDEDLREVSDLDFENLSIIGNIGRVGYL